MAPCAARVYRVGMGQVRLLAILAQPDDESLGFGGTLAKYAAEGVEVSLITATRGEAGRFHGHRPGEPEHPGASALGAIRAQELLDAGRALGIREVRLLDYRDAELDRANPYEATATLAHHVRDLRPDVVVTFGPDGAYGHPDHVKVHRVAVYAAELAGTRRVLEATMNRDLIVQLRQAARQMGEAGAEAEADFDPNAPADDGNPFGSTAEEITLAVDVQIGRAHV